MAIGLAACLVCAQAGSHGQELIVSASFTGKTSIAPDEQIALRASRSLPSSEGRLAVIIGQTDWTDLFVATNDGLTYSPATQPLPLGETQLTVFFVAPDNEWKEIARFQLRVAGVPVAAPPVQTTPQPAPTPRRKAGFDNLRVAPSLNLGVKSQPVESHFPETNRPQRETFADLTLQGGLQTEMSRGAFNAQSQFSIVGSSFRGEALRFFERGNDAPKIDLAGYSMQFQSGKSRLTAGQTFYGKQRHLINNLASRGITLTMPINKRGDLSLGVMSSTNIVGWSNFLGIARSDHRVVSGTIGAEMILKRPGGLRVEASLLDGARRPLSGFNQSNINDAERSRGFGFRLQASDKTQRLRVDTGFSRSSFTNPSDPLLSQGANLIPAPETARNAEYADVSYDLLRNRELTKTQRATVTVNLRHERVDPFYRSIAAFTQADRMQNQIEVVATIGALNATATHQRSEDNLDDVATIPKTRMRRNGVVFSAPLAQLFARPDKPMQANPWLPRIFYNFDQWDLSSGTGNAGFGQAMRNQSLMADWQGKRWRTGYRFNRSSQRQQSTSLGSFTNGLSFGLNATKTFDLNFDLNADSATNSAVNQAGLTGRTNRTWRVASNINWRVTPLSTLAATFSGTLAGDTAQITRNRNSNFDFQFSRRFGVEKNTWPKFQGQVFIRYANVYSQFRDSLFGFNTLNKSWTINSGVNLTLF